MTVEEGLGATCWPATNVIGTGALRAPTQEFRKPNLGYHEAGNPFKRKVCPRATIHAASRDTTWNQRRNSITDGEHPRERCTYVGGARRLVGSFHAKTLAGITTTVRKANNKYRGREKRGGIRLSRPSTRTEPVNGRELRGESET